MWYIQTKDVREDPPVPVTLNYFLTMPPHFSILECCSSRLYNNNCTEDGNWMVTETYASIKDLAIVIERAFINNYNIIIILL